MDYAFFGGEEGWLNLSIWYLTAFSEGLFSFTGIGYSSQVIETYLNIYYIIILSWALFYLFSSFTTVLPWASCNNPWNSGTPSSGWLLVGGKVGDGDSVFKWIHAITDS